MVRALVRKARGPAFDPQLRCLNFSFLRPSVSALFLRLVCLNGLIDAIDSWRDTVQCSVSQFVPKTVFTARPGNKPWYSSLLHKLRRQKECLFCHAKPFDQQHPLSVAYCKVRNWYTAELRNAERLYYLRLTDSLSNKEMLRTPHRWWALAKSVCGLRARDPVPPLQAGGRAHLSA